MSDGSTIALVLGLVFTGIIIAVFVVTFFVITRKGKQQRSKTYNERYSTTSAHSSAATQAVIANKQRAETQPTKHELHLSDAKEHAHLGEEEHYEEIVGSLGEVNDEGCIDLDGVRFIAHDVAYDTDEGTSPHTINRNATTALSSRF